MKRTSGFRQQDILAATVLLAMTWLPVADAFATPILYFGDGKTSSGGGGGGGNGGVGGGPTGGAGSGFMGGPRSGSGAPSITKSGKTQPDVASSASTETTRYSSPASATGGGALSGAGTTSSSSTVPPGSTPTSSRPSTSSNSSDPVTQFFEDLSMDLGEVDVLEGPKAAPLAQAFDAAEIISNVADVSVSDLSQATGRGADAPTISFGAPETGVTLTIEDFIPGAETASLAVHMPEPASLFLLGTGLLLTAQYRRLRRRRTGTRVS